MNSQLNIVPSVTLIKNVGLGERSAHSNIPFECVPKQLQEAFYGDCYEMEFPLRHTKYVMDNVLYKKQLYAITGRGNPWKRGARRIVGVCRRIANGDIRRLINSLVRKLRGK